MAQAIQRRQEIIEAQRRADSGELVKRAGQGMTMREIVVATQQHMDIDSDDDDEVADGPTPEEQKQDRISAMQQALQTRKRHIHLAEKNLEVEEKTKPTLWGYRYVFLIAGAKDLIDLGFVTILPGIGFIVAIMFWTAMLIALYLAKTNRSLFEIKRVATMTVGFILESLGFLLSALPMQTITAIAIYFIDKLESNKLIARALQILENVQKHAE